MLTLHYGGAILFNYKCSMKCCNVNLSYSHIHTLSINCYFIHLGVSKNDGLGTGSGYKIALKLYSSEMFKGVKKCRSKCDELQRLIKSK